jgi:hypothetical protein
VTKYNILSGLSFALILGGTLFLLSLEPKATLKYKKETDKNCTFCHTGIPRKGDEDPQLTEDGKKFKENGNKLTEEQKRKPSE